MIVRTLAAILLSICVWSNLAYGQAPFFQGKTITIVVGYQAGDGYDIWSRLLAAHMGKHIAGNPGLIAQNILSSDVEILTPLTLVVILEFAFVEELIFRLGIQNYLGAKLIKRRYGYASAIVLTAALWSMAHVGSLNPDWVKLAQIFPLGLALGWLYRRQGTESTIMAHALFNVLGGLVLSPLYLR